LGSEGILGIFEFDMGNKTATLLVGAGAVENAWQPVINAIKETTNRNIDASNANCFFAQLIYLARFYSTIDHPDAKYHLQVMLDNIAILKEQICHNLKEAQRKSEIKARPELELIISKFITSKNNKAIIVSTNWDTVVENKVNTLYRFPENKQIPCLHIHGDINSDIYLPSEITTEHYRSKEEDKNFGVKHSDFFRIIETTDILILYGISLSPLDAELLQVFYNIPNFVNQIIIINPDHKSVANNISAIVEPNCKIKITGYHPSDLETEYNYR
jgi:hypothetical protein